MERIRRVPVFTFLWNMEGMRDREYKHDVYTDNLDTGKGRKI